MARVLLIGSLLLLVGCADQSRGTALSECRLKHYLDPSAAQAQLIPDCMRAKSFDMTAACAPSSDDREWDWQVRTFNYDNPRCYQVHGSSRWIATALSPM